MQLFFDPKTKDLQPVAPEPNCVLQQYEIVNNFLFGLLYKSTVLLLLLLLFKHLNNGKNVFVKKYVFTCVCISSLIQGYPGEKGEAGSSDIIDFNGKLLDAFQVSNRKRQCELIYGCVKEMPVVYYCTSC